MKSAQDYINESKTVEQAIAKAHQDAVCEIVEELRYMDERDLYIECFKQYNEELVHSMDELDDVFSSLSATEILEQLSNINTSDAYFNERELTSGDNIWEVSGMTSYDMAEWILDEDAVEGTCGEIVYEFSHIEEQIEAYYDRINIAKKLFEQCLKAYGVDEIISTLWNM